MLLLKTSTGPLVFKAIVLTLKILSLLEIVTLTSGFCNVFSALTISPSNSSSLSKYKNTTCQYKKFEYIDLETRERRNLMKEYYE